MDQDQSGTITMIELYKFIIRVTKMDNPETTDVSRFIYLLVDFRMCGYHQGQNTIFLSANIRIKGIVKVERFY